MLLFDSAVKGFLGAIYLWQSIALYLLTVTGLRGPLWTLFVHVLTNYRSLLVLFVVMPMSFVFDFFWRLRTWYIAKVKTAPQLHNARVKNIQEQVRQWAATSRSKHMCTARPGWMTVSPRHCQYKQTLFTVNIDLTDILSLDEKHNLLRVEPSVNILQILDYLLPRGYTLPVVPELDELTVGGLVNGYGIETSSHVHGLFNDICESFELVLPDGSVRTVNRSDKLFYAIPWSFGTVGFLTAVELRVQRATKFVRHKYIPVTTKEQCVQVWTELQTARNPPDFLEGIMYTEDTGIVCAASYTNGDQAADNGVKLNRIDWWYKPYFYMHCKSFLDTLTEYTELIPLRQYYQRHNRSIFWALQDQIPVCNNALFRTVFGWMLPPRVAFLKLIESDAVTKFYEENYVMQDWLVPLENMLDTIKLCHKELAVYPLWLCPFKVYNTGKFQGKIRAPPGTERGGSAHYIDIATIGPPGVRGFNTVKAIGAVEDYLRKNNGYQGNYSYTYQSIDQFRKMFDHRLYDEVRQELGSDVAFPESFFKIARQNQYTTKDTNGKIVGKSE